MEGPTDTPVVDLGATASAPLAVHLLDLLHALEGADVPLVLVGGFGLFLRREYVSVRGIETAYPVVPPPRATEDFDVLLRLQLLADVERMRRLRAALDGLGYRVVPGAETFQFTKPDTAWGGGFRDVKVDLLARLPAEGDPPLPLGGVRVMPRPRNNPLHARVTPEAIAAEDGLSPIPVEGVRSDGGHQSGEVFLPPPYALYLMKLFAFRDEETGRKGAGRERYARKHALDLYALTALLTAPENDALPTYRDRYATHPIALRAADIVREYFSEETQKGVLRIRETGAEVPNLSDFLALLRETFP